MPSVNIQISAGVLLALTLLAIAYGIRRARGTTLVAPLAWTMAAFIAIAVATLALPAQSSRADGDKWMFVAAVATLCPTVALFGAKRPQDRAWQMIVLAFWFVVAMPGLQSLLVQSGEPLELHQIWKWFIAVLIVAGAINHLPTRFVGAAFLLAIAQTSLFWSHLPIPSRLTRVVSTAESATLGFFFLMAAVGAALWSSRRAKQQLAGYRGWNRTWRDFRDCYGVVWSLRIIERVNTFPIELETPVRLRWDGFYVERRQAGNKNCSETQGSHATYEEPAEEAAAQPSNVLAPPDAVAPLDAALRNLFRRFVSSDWLAERL